VTDKCTTIHLPGSEWNGLLECGEETVEAMIEKAKSYAEYEVRQHQQVLDAKPEDFEVEVVRGVYVQRHIRWLQRPSDLDSHGKSE